MLVQLHVVVQLDLILPDQITKFLKSDLLSLILAKLLALFSDMRCCNVKINNLNKYELDYKTLLMVPTFTSILLLFNIIATRQSYVVLPPCTLIPPYHAIVGG